MRVHDGVDEVAKATSFGAPLLGALHGAVRGDLARRCQKWRRAAWERQNETHHTRQTQSNGAPLRGI